jgi:2-polyprenyl-3-methyl-5-hydroxy-6-metoxy-1,4-benzoquinol methylase
MNERRPDGAAATSSVTATSSADRNRDYYDETAGEFFERTRGLDMEQHYLPFLSLLEPGARILDAGCGSGRDMKAFSKRGYRVAGMDASEAMVRLAREHTNEQVHHLAFQEVTWEEEFDGIWACASLLHVARRQLPEVLERLGRALRPGGVLFMSYKHGQGEHSRNGRRFTDLDEPLLRELLRDAPGLTLKQSWQSRNVQRKPVAEVWLNAIAVK